MAGIFRAYDIRGVYPDEIDEETAYRIGRATSRIIPRGRICVGRDMRISAPSIKEALVRGLTDSGLDVDDIGLVSTPMNYFAVGKYGYDGGIQVTASHNPGRYIGMKFTRKNVVPVSYEGGLNLLEEEVGRGAPPPPVTRGGTGTNDRVGEGYGRHILGLIGPLAPLKIVVDASNGMGSVEFPLVFDWLPCRVARLNFDLDGTFPNHDPNPLKDESRRELVETVRETGADLGAIFDGDADRVAFVDEGGNFIHTDYIVALLARPYIEREPGAGIVFDFRASRSVEESIVECGGTPYTSRVGHSYIKEKMRKVDAVFGGDVAGHYYFRDNYFSEASSLTLAKVLELMTARKAPLSALAAPLGKYFSTGELNYEVTDKERKLEEVARELAVDCGELSHFDGITCRMPDAWFNVRASNTEPLVRFIAESGDPSTLEALKKRVEKILLSD